MLVFLLITTIRKCYRTLTETTYIPLQRIRTPFFLSPMGPLGEEIQDLLNPYSPKIPMSIGRDK